MQVQAGEVEIQGGIYDLETGRVEFLGQSPAQAPWPATHTQTDGQLQSPAGQHLNDNFSSSN